VDCGLAQLTSPDSHYSPIHQLQPHPNIHTHTHISFPRPSLHRRQRAESPAAVCCAPPQHRRRLESASTRHTRLPWLPPPLTHSKHLHLPPPALQPPLIAVCCPISRPLSPSPAASRPANPPESFQPHPRRLCCASTHRVPLPALTSSHSGLCVSASAPTGAACFHPSSIAPNAPPVLCLSVAVPALLAAAHHMRH
jgi:hypothetical protein